MSLLKGKLIMGKPTALHVTHAKPGLHSDGQGLVLQAHDGSEAVALMLYSCRFLSLGM